MNIKEIFKTLTQGQRDCLMASFDKMEPCTIEYETNKFIACHLTDFTGFNIIDKTEYWVLFSQ